MLVSFFLPTLYGIFGITPFIFVFLFFIRSYLFLRYSYDISTIFLRFTYAIHVLQFTYRHTKNADLYLKSASCGPEKTCLYE